ncbi:hypothetical protein KAURM247S_06291 [Kitasatospora aureofaciens]
MQCWQASGLRSFVDPHDAALPGGLAAFVADAMVKEPRGN